MIGDLPAAGVLVGALGLVTMPLVARRFSRSFRPVELTQYNSVTMAAGVTVLFTALVLCALPVVSSLLGAGLTNRHFFPGNAAIGWISAMIAFAVLAAATIGRRQSREVERRLVVEPSIGHHVAGSEYELVVLETERPLAYAVVGDHPQVVLTTGLLSTLTVDEVVSVVEHEAAHIQLGHRRHLAVISLLDPLAAWISPLRRLLEVARLALERAADAATTNRNATRTALLRLNGVWAAPGVAAFTAGDVVDRLEALSAPETSANASIRALLYLGAGILGVMSLAALLLFVI